MSDSMYGQQQRVQTVVVQLGASQKMTVDARNAMNMPKDEAGQRDWSTGLFTCLDDIFTFGLSWFCPCVVYSQVKTRTEYLEAHGRPHPDGGELVGPDCALYGCLTVCGGCSVIFQYFQRAELRNRYNIRGDPAMDVLATCFCRPCALTQQSREVELEERALMGMSPNKMA